MRTVPYLLASAALSAVMIPLAAHADGESQYRIFVGDHADGIVRAFDVEDGAAVGTFEIEQTPALTRSASGQTVFAVQGGAGTVAVIDTGVRLEDHGDHRDLIVGAPSLLDVALSGTTPAHVVDSVGTIALFDDGTGEVALFAESALASGGFAPLRIATGAAHHGLAAPMGDFLVVSMAGADADAPRYGLRVVDRGGDQVGEAIECPGVHGQARSAGIYAFGCRDGVVIAQPARTGDAPELRHLATAELGEGHVSTLRGASAMQAFLGNYGPSAMVMIDPEADDAFTRIDLPTRRVDFALDPIDMAAAYVLTEDGHLHRLDLLSGEIATSAPVTQPYSMDGHWRDPRPRLAVAGDVIAITDPREGLVRLVSKDDLAERSTIEVEGTPYTIVAVGGSGAVHD